MAELAYREVYIMNPIEARRRLVKTYQETHNYSETARLWHTSRQVARNWIRRFQAEGEAGLHDRSRRLHHSPHQTPSEVQGVGKWDSERTSNISGSAARGGNESINWQPPSQRIFT